jgi:cellulose synthase/poly-beta-1,6-N-acetylglucosamine synthase-like glycosyltransferase
MYYYFYLIFFVPVFLLFALFGAYRLWLLILYREKNSIRDINPLKNGKRPFVTIQIPIYNELNVVERVIESAFNLDYQKELYEIQVLDDSTDETKEIVDKMVKRGVERGFLIYVIRRDNRKGFKAGALKEGLKKARGELIAIFDADFIIPRDFLKRTVSYFKDRKVGFVQVRWGYLNEDENIITKTCAMTLNTHFEFEQFARYKGGYFFGFNGTAGIWRKDTIIDAGNWEGDTLAEDLDLSLRAYLRGWKGVFLRDYFSPSELPSDFSSFLKQQKRWTKGTFQVGIKMWKKVLSSNLEKEDKVNILFHLFSPFLYVLNTFFFVFLWPLSKYCDIFFGMLVLFLGIINFYNIWISNFYNNKYISFKDKLKYMFFVIILYTSFCVTATKVILEVFKGKGIFFERTPKKGNNKKNYFEIEREMGMDFVKVFYSLLTIFISVKLKIWGVLPWLFLFSISSMYYLNEKVRDILMFLKNREEESYLKVPITLFVKTKL